MSLERPLVSDAGEPLDAIGATQNVEAARSAIANWLLHSGAQQISGENAGAVAGWLAPSGRADYVYPEITGYYLQWLAWHALRRGMSTDLAEKAESAQRWLAAWSSREGIPQTRVYLRADEDDWRNRTLFFFDLAMVLRGLAWSTYAGLLLPDPALVDRLCALLRRLLRDDGMFDACTIESRAGHVETLPRRWSTRRGPFLIKAAEGVLRAARWLPDISADIVDAADATFDASLKDALVSPHRETHPFLYALEGTLNCADARRTADATPQLAAQFHALLDGVDGGGRLPEVSDAAGANRLDIVAQAIRVDSVLHPRLNSHQDRTLRATSTMLRLLVDSTSPSGALPFAPDQKPVQFNVWTAMFAEQALTLVQDRLSGRAVPWTDPCLI